MTSGDAMPGPRRQAWPSIPRGAAGACAGAVPSPRGAARSTRERREMSTPGTVRVLLFGALHDWAPSGDVIEADAAVGSVAGLLRSLGLPQRRVGLAVVNGKRVALDVALQPGDEIGLFPPRR